ncbi:MAG: DUF2267 domain-containing protein [Cyanobacteria bacterium J06597_1]
MTATQIPSAPSAVTEASPFQIFLDTVVVRGGLDSDYDARDIAEVVFRTMRDVMPTELSNRIANELASQSAPLSELWRDTNALVRWLSQIRPVLEIRDEVFVRRIQQEAGVPLNVNAADVMAAVFSATKQVLSAESATEIARHLPGQIRMEWNRA